MFSFGGIGATPDDHTRACAARAAGVALALHPDAEAEIRARFATTRGVTPQRLMMGEFPVGLRRSSRTRTTASPASACAATISCPGFPQMAWPMMEWVLDTRYRDLFAPGRIGERSIIVARRGESQLIDLMNECLARYPALKVFSLPRMQPDRHVELGVRGDPRTVATAIAALKEGVSALGFPWTDPA